MEITTRSGKVLQGENEQLAEVQDSAQEFEAQVEVPIVVGAKKVPEELKIQEVNREEVKENVKEMPKTLAQIPRPPPPFPQRLARKVDDTKLEKFYEILKQLSVCSIIATTTVQNKEDLGAFTIPCTIGARDFARSLCDNGARINLIPLAIYKQARLGMPRPTSMRLQMADRSIKRPVEIVDDVFVKVGKFLLLANFVILDCAVDKEILSSWGDHFLLPEEHLWIQNEMRSSSELMTKRLHSKRARV
uniref:Uncharacterized protein n=1 Tax=Nicotiana tabacum TaxID=4097 RepID=A0A1S4B630_TOBAC|nr:PREDICTED: uncharacterized protein LOC107804897 [Nicotiana tabacum]